MTNQEMIHKINTLENKLSIFNQAFSDVVKYMEANNKVNEKFYQFFLKETNEHNTSTI